MMQAVRGIFRGGIVELLEQPGIVGEAEVVVTFLSPGGSLGADDSLEELATEFTDDASPLDDFEPIVPAQPGLLSEIVLEGRR